ncbi:MAG: bifunctional precorrin-2 dehydrogenase/sirohydrochlorin ferrochelatase [Tepidibacter sp.]|jgi:precorrin-2 dehydrogenase/sirohydrochlorin ferrochelatase|uniref:precorrin-2 dehydrogenase/sirohydrochlorin ferrochelatase family protein n=1 Tax=Tepidibacter sp. TaxID=2529387 RepID=UPI0025E10015|nr:bifunctional precorrin-2 dehydrogenase/sirohydrochlorin ferrochelatase [Tepidibacter sp.]MCT4509502.1 bifunctional precorrin-2 dehydrogenase/sirohydrochlorin ferrochelatase [Tepidibacter sp.]
MINLDNKNVTIIGGGKVAFRKAKKFLEFNCNIKLVSSSFIEDFDNIDVKLINDNYKEDYLKESFLVIAATSSKKVNEDIASYCKTNNIMCNIADDINLSDFIVPSSIKRGDLVISVSTMGNSPSLSSKIRKELESNYGVEYEEYVSILGDIRNLVLQKCTDKDEKKRILNELVNLDLEELKKRRLDYENNSWN